MTSAVLFLLLSLMSSTIVSLPTGLDDRKDTEDDDSMGTADSIESVNSNLDRARGGPRIMYGDIAMASASRNAVPCTAKGCTWPKSKGGFVYIPYSIASSFTEDQRNVILQGLKSFESVTCIRFVQRDQQQDFIHFFSGVGCWSVLGRQGGKQLVSLHAPGCVYHGMVQHEVLHALGFHHEQSRSDRDDHVTIITENIQPGRLHIFDKVATNNLNTPYDYNSIMHYGRYAFSKEWGVLPTIVPKPNPNAVIGQARQMSTNDINRINRLYQCS